MFDKFISWVTRHKWAEPVPTATPFVDEEADFYFQGDEERIRRFELLVQLLSSGGVLLLLGESGVGKSALLRQLRNRAGDSCRVCQLNPAACIDHQRTLARLLECFDTQTEIDPGLIDAQLRCLREHLGIMRRDGYTPVVIIDDAGALPDTVFALLAQLFVNDGAEFPTLILTGGPDLKQRLSGPLLHTLHTHVVHELEIQPFSAEEQSDYIHQCLQRTGVEGMGPFHASTLKFIHVASRGVPQRINGLARVFWAKYKNRQGFRSRIAWLADPRFKRLRYLMPLLFIGIAVAFFHDQFRTPQLPASPPSQVAAGERGVNVPDSVNEHQQADAGDEQAATTGRADVPAGSGQTSAKTVATDAANSAADADIAIRLPAAVKRVSPSSPAQGEMTRPATVSEAGEAEASTETSKGSGLAPEKAVVAAVLALKRQGQEPHDGDSRGGRAGAQATGRTSDDDWWLTQPGGQFAVQLMAMEADVVRDYIALHGLEGFNVATYSVRYGHKKLLAAALGPVATRAEAEKMARQWQQRLPDIKPWVRSVASIQQSVAENHRQAAPDWAAMVAKHEQQLLQKRPQDYAVQLMAMDRAAVTGFVEKYDLADRVMYFQTRSGGQVVYAALLGSFPSREQAEQASREIVQQTTGVRPWVRSLASVQQAIRTRPDHPR